MKKNYAVSKYILALILSFNVYCKEEFTVPQTLIDQVEKGNAEIAYFIAATFLEGSEKFAANHDKAMKWLDKAASMGYAYAMKDLAIEYDNQSQLKKALDWYLKAAELGLGSVLNPIATFHYYGLAGLDKNCLTAYEWFEKGELKEEKLAFNNHAWFMATSEDKKCRNPEKALKIIADLISLYEEGEYIPWHIIDTQAAVYASVSDFGAAIKLQQWLIDEMQKVNEKVKPAYQKHLDSYKLRKPWIEAVEMH